MSIRMIAKDLYRLQQEVDRLESILAGAPSDKKEVLENQLRKVKAERNRIRRALDGSKEPPTYSMGKD
jgi:hypothetical protein